MSIFTGRLGLVCSRLGSFQLGSSKACTTAYTQALSAALPLAGSIIRRASHVLVATLSFAGAAARQASRALAGTLGLAGAVTKRAVSHVLSASVAPSGALVRQAGHLLAASMSLAGSLSRLGGKALSATLPLGATARRAVTRALSATLPLVGATAKMAVRLLPAGSIALAASIVKRAGKALTATLAFETLEPVAVADLNGNGRSDIVWQNPVTGDVYVSQMSGTSVVASARLGSAAGKVLIAVGDFDGNGRDELLFRNAVLDTSAPVMWFPDATGLAISATTNVDRSPDWTIYDVKYKYAGDTNGDGKADVIFRADGASPDYVWCMNGASVIAEAVGGTGALRVVSSQWKHVAFADFDSSGTTDIFWRDMTTGDTYYYPLSGSTIGAGEGYVRNVSDQNWQVFGAGQFDATGGYDVLWRNSTTLEGYIYALNGTTITANEGYILGMSVFASSVLVGVGKFSSAVQNECLMWDPVARIARIAGVTFNGTGTSTQYTIAAGSAVKAPIEHLVKRAGKALAATLSFAGTAAKRTARALAAVLSFAGLLDADSAKARSFSATLAFTGAATKRTSHLLTATLASIGDLAKRTARATTATLSFAGAIVKRAGKALGALLTWLTASRHDVFHVLFATLPPAGSTSARTSRALAATLALLGSLAKRPSRALAGSVALLGAFSKQAGKALAATLPLSGAASRFIGRGLSATLLSIGALSRTTSRALAATFVLLGAIAKQAGRALSATLALLGSISKRTTRALAATLPPIAALNRRVLRSLSAILNEAGVVAAGNRYSRALAATIASSGSSVRSTLRPIAASLAALGALANPLSGARVVWALAVRGVTWVLIRASRWVDSERPSVYQVEKRDDTWKI